MEDHDVNERFHELVKGLPELTEVKVSLGDIARAGARLQEASMWLAEFVQMALNKAEVNKEAETFIEFPDDLLTVLAQLLPLSFELTETLSGVMDCNCDQCDDDDDDEEDED